MDTNGIITTVAGNVTFGYSGDGGLATCAKVGYPEGIVVDSLGNIFIADPYNYCVREVDANGVIRTIAGSLSGAGVSPIDAGRPDGLVLDHVGNLLVADSSANRIRLISCVSAITPTLTLNNLGDNNAGNYSVIVSSPFGCITSSVVTLSLSTALQPQSFAGSVTQGTNVALQFKGGTPSFPYVLQSATHLSSPVDWQPVATNSTDGNGAWNFTVTNAAGEPARFYRVLGQ